jgi:hypothetical protein
MSQVNTASSEDVNSSNMIRLICGTILIWALTGWSLKWVATIVAILAGASYAFGQVYRRRHPGQTPVRPQIPRTGQSTDVPAGEFGKYKADTGVLRAARGESPSVNMYPPLGASCNHQGTATAENSKFGSRDRESKGVSLQQSSGKDSGTSHYNMPGGTANYPTPLSYSVQQQG